MAGVERAGVLRGASWRARADADVVRTDVLYATEAAVASDAWASSNTVNAMLAYARRFA